MINEIGVDLSKQYTKHTEMTEYLTLKMKNQQAFQISFTLKAIQWLEDNGIISINKRLSIVDVGDSAGTHMKYLRHRLEERYTDMETVSVNLDPVAVQKIRQGGESGSMQGGGL